MIEKDTSPIRNSVRTAALRDALRSDPRSHATFDRLARLAARMLRAPVAQVNFVSVDQQISFSSVGPDPWAGPRAVPLDYSYCKHVSASGEPLLIGDAREHPLVRENRATRESGIVAYAAAPLTHEELGTVGTLCVVDFRPRTWTEEDTAILEDLAAAAMVQIRLREEVQEREAAEARLQHIVEASPAYLYVLTLDGRDVVDRWASSSITRVTGYTLEEALQPTWWTDHLHPEDLPAALAAFDPLFERGEITHEYRFRHRDGHWIWVRDYLRLIRSSEGTPVEIVGSWLDVTDRRGAEDALRASRDDLERRVRERTRELGDSIDKLQAQIDERQRAERALAESEARFRATFEQAAVGIAHVGLEGHWLRVNERLCDIVDYPREELLRLTFQDITYPEDLEADLQQLGRLLAGDIESYQMEKRYIRRDGDLVWILLTVSLVRRSDGEPDYLIAVVEEISARKRAEAALIRREEYFRSLIENVGEIITVLDADGTIRYESPAAQPLLGYSTEDLLGRSAFELIHPEDVPAAQGTLAEVLRNPGQHLSFTLRFRHQDGSWRTFEGIGTNLLHDPAVAGIVANSRDVTGRVRLEEQLRQAQKMEAVGRLAGGIAHDFNNLLTAIKINAQFLLADLPARDPSREDAQEIRNAAERAASLTQQLLAFSRQQVLQPKVLDLNEAVRETESMLRRMIGEDVEFVTRLDPDLGRVEADPGQIGQVLMNLAVNARDAMPNGGKLLIETRNVPLGEKAKSASPFLPAGTPGVLLAVSDTGEGIPAELQERIFEPFFTTKEQGKGTGLGLSTVYGIVKQTGGYVWVYSEVGQGTTFKIYLPRTAAAADAPESAPAPGEGQRSGTILLVEDDPMVRSVTERTLQRSGYRVLTAEGGAEALRLAQEHREPIDLLVTDVVMPNMKGRELSERLLAVRPEVKVLFISGYTDEAIVHHGLLDPEIAFLQKPFGPEDLARKVSETLNSTGP